MDARGAVDLSNQAHERSDVDFGPQSQHHTLGNGPFQAAPGSHKHGKTIRHRSMKSIVFSTPTGAWQLVYHDTVLETDDTKNWNINNINGAVTPKVPGIYNVEFHFTWAATGGQLRAVAIQKNLTGIAPANWVGAQYLGPAPYIQTCVQCCGNGIYMNGTDYFTFFCYQDSGVAINSSAGPGYSGVSIVKVGDV